MKRMNILALMTIFALTAYPLTGCEKGETTRVETTTTTNENEEMSTTTNNSSYQVAHNGVDHFKEDPMMKSMMKSMDKMKTMSMTGHPDQDFAMMMIEHHKGAIDMAKIEIEHGKDANLKKMSQDIIKKQEKEIKDMKAYVDKFKSSHKDGGMHKVSMSDPFNKKMMASMKMGKMHTDKKASIDHKFLEHMIMHHQQGIDMAKAELAHGKDASMKKMATQIIADQQKEIKIMQAMLNKKA